MELRKLTTYVENLWKKDQDKFTEILEVFRLFNSRLSRLESIVDVGKDMRNSSEFDHGNFRDTCYSSDVDYVNQKNRPQFPVEPMPRKSTKSIEFEETMIKANDMSVNAIVEASPSRPNAETAKLNKFERGNSIVPSNSLQPSLENAENPVVEASTVAAEEASGPNAETAQLNKVERRNGIVPSNSLQPTLENAENPEFAELEASIVAAEEEYKSLKDNKKGIKSQIENWIQDFTAKNGVAPSVKDKESIHSYYVDYKAVSNALQDATQELFDLKKQLAKYLRA